MTIINNKYLFNQNEDKASNNQARFAVIARLLIESDLREIKKVMKIKKQYSTLRIFSTGC